MAQKFLSIKNFEKYQHFKKANPPWIKLYRSTLNDRAFINLPTVSKYVYLGLLILASEGCNKVFNDPSWISHRLAIKVSELDIRPLYKAGFLIASESTAYRETISQSRDRVETETEERERDAPPLKVLSLKKAMRTIHESDSPTDKHRAFAAQLNIDIGPEWAKFKNYCLAHDKRYANFEAAFRNWLARSAEMKGERRGLL